MMKDTKLAFLYETIDALGYRVEFGNVAGDRDGETIHEKKLVRIQWDLTVRPYRSTVGHECAHVVFRDHPSRFGPVNAKQERRADEWAARQLITLDEYRAAEARHDGHIEAMAIDLLVTVDIVQAFQRVLLRIGDTVYVDPRMGAGQAEARIDLSLEGV